MLKLTGDFNIATHNEKRKNQMKALQSLILVLEEYDNGDSQQQIQAYKVHNNNLIKRLHSINKFLCNVILTKKNILIVLFKSIMNFK